MNKNEEIDYLINELISVNNRIDKNMEIPQDYSEKRKLLRALMNIQTPVHLSDRFYEIQDKILSEETENKNLAYDSEIRTISENPDTIESKIALWQGDITCLKVDGIVNAANSQMLGCEGPAITYDSLPNEKDYEKHENCYKSCLELADSNGLKSLAFCSISTGVFNFPKEEACKIAIKTVKDYLTIHENTNLEKVIFNTFSDDATEIYRKYLGIN